MLLSSKIYRSFKPVLVLATAVLSVSLVACKESNAAAKTDTSGAEVEVTEQITSTSDEAVLILERLSRARPDLKFTSAIPADIEGLYEVTFEGGRPIYVFPSGEHFVVGEIYKVEETGIVNLTERKLDGKRKELMSGLDEREMIIFEPKGKAKAEIFVFTDVDCGYCRLIHKEVPALNELGVRVKYLAYPRAGIGSEAYKKMASAWCSRDPQGSLTALKDKKNIPQNVCAQNPVANHFDLGRQVGVTGTPALVLESGELVPGYMKAPQLAAKLGI